MSKMDTKTIYIEIDEELTSLIDRFKRAKEANIVVVVPKRAVLLQSVVNLKLLKSQAEKFGKELSLVTTDKTGRNLASQVGLTVYQSLDTNGRSSRALDDEVFDVVKEDEVDRAMGVKMSIEETINDGKVEDKKKKFWVRRDGNKEENESRSSDFVPESKTITVVSPNKKILGGLLTVSILLLMIIGYYVLPNSTIKVQPKIEKISYTTNLTLVDSDRYQSLLDSGEELKMVGSFPIEITELIHTKEYQATGERFTGKSPEGKIRIINTVAQPWQFVATTRFQSEDGIVFRLKEGVRIGGNQNTEVEVIADEKDINGQIVGARGNLEKGVKLIIPGLREDSQQKVYGEVSEDITSGISSSVKVLTREDVLAAKANIIDELFNIGETKLIERIEEENQRNGLNMRLFRSRDVESVTKEVIEVLTPDDLIDKDVTTFQVTAKIKVRGIAYEQTQILDIMTKGLEVKVLEDRLMVDAKGEEIEFNVVTKEDAEKKMKVEATIQGITEYKVNSRLGDKIRGKILNKSLDEAQAIIKEMPEIGEVRVEAWPFWVKRIPGVRSNIKVERL
jgi:hypothetical protein